MTEFQVHVDVNGATGNLRWDEQRVDVETLQRAVSLAADDVLVGRGLRRLQVEIPEWDTAARTALHRAGFRLEGRLRASLEREPGDYRDSLIYARLAVDPVYGVHGHSGVLNSILPTKRVIAHALLRDEAGRVLLLETTYKSDWELPGGVAEVGEPPKAAAEREILEEIGLEVRLGQPLLADWMPPYLGWSDAVEFIFDAGVVDAATVATLAPSDREIKALHWVAPAMVTDHVTELSARRIALMLEGRQGYTEAGYLDAT